MEYQNVYVNHRSPFRTLTRTSTTFWFLSGTNIHLYGGGTLDANGQVWWDYPNKVSSLPLHPPSTISHLILDCGHPRRFCHRLCATHTPDRGQCLERSHRRSHPNRLSSLGTHIPCILLLIIQSHPQNNFVYQSTNVTYRRINISSTSYSSNPPANSGIIFYRIPLLLS